MGHLAVQGGSRVLKGSRLLFGKGRVVKAWLHWSSGMLGSPNIGP